MKINEVEAAVGVTKKNIRFYEEKGLIAPRRNSENGYREYGPGEVEQLKQIKLLRKLGVYSVSCYKDQFDKLDAAGALELRPDGSAILTDTSCYSEKTGLAMDVETGIGLYF